MAHKTLGIEPIHPDEQVNWDHEPGMGADDVSKCLPGWIKWFCEQYAKGEDITLTQGAARAVIHTLMAARVRQHRLIKERDEK